MDSTPLFPDGPPPWPMADPAVRAALEAVAADGSWGQYHGPHVERLERMLAQYHQVPTALTCASGTMAVEVALRAVGVGPGDEVVLSAYDYEPSFLTIHALGARPVLVDVLPTAPVLDPIHLPPAIGLATKAVLATHLHGALAPMADISAITGGRGIALIEDAAQVPGAMVDGRPAGSWGDIGTLSFGGSKLLTAGRGGAVLVRDSAVAQRARLALSRGIQQLAPLSEIQAAILLPQIAALDLWTRHRAENVEALADVPGLRSLRTDRPGCRSAYYKLGFAFDAAAFGLSRSAFVAALRSEGVAFDAGYRPLHVGRAPSRYRAAGPLPNASAFGESIVMLHHPVLSLGREAVDRVAEAVRKTYRNATRRNALPP